MHAGNVQLVIGLTLTSSLLHQTGVVGGLGVREQRPQVLNAETRHEA